MRVVRILKRVCVFFFYVDSLFEKIFIFIKTNKVQAYCNTDKWPVRVVQYIQGPLCYYSLVHSLSEPKGRGK